MRVYRSIGFIGFISFSRVWVYRVLGFKAFRVLYRVLGFRVPSYIRIETYSLQILPQPQTGPGSFTSRSCEVLRSFSDARLIPALCGLVRVLITFMRGLGLRV